MTAISVNAAVEKQDTQDALQKSLERERLTRRVVELANHTTDIRTILDTIAREIGKFFKVDRAYLVHYKEEGGKYKINLYAEYYTEDDELGPSDITKASPRLQQIWMREQSIENLQATVCLTTVEACMERFERVLQEEDLTPEEYQALYDEQYHLLVHYYKMCSLIRVPIIYRGVPYGTISLQQHHYSRIWKQDEIELLEEIALQIGNALYQVDLYQQEQATRQALESTLERERMIRRIVETISQSFDINFILKTVAESLGEYLQADRCSVSRCTVENDKLLIDLSAQYAREGCKPVDEEDLALITNAVQDLSPEVLNYKQEQIINIPDQDQYLAHIRKQMAELPFELPGLDTEKMIGIVLKYGIRSSLRVTICYRGIPYGSISVSQSSYNRQWLPDEVELVKALAEHAGSAIYQADLYRKEQLAKEMAEKRLRHEAFMRRMVELVNQPFDLQQIMNSVLRELAEFLHVERGVATRYSLQGDELKLLFTSQYSVNPALASITTAELATLLKATHLVSPEWFNQELGQTFVVNDVEQITSNYHAHMKQLSAAGKIDYDAILQASEKFPVKSFLRVGIFHRGELFGSISLSQCTHLREWQPDEVELVNFVANHLGIALHQLDLYQQEQIARQEAESANKKKSNFLAMMSHELRTPLNSIIGYSRMLEKGIGGQLSTKQYKYVQSIGLSGNHLLNIINDLLDISKVEAGKMYISPSLFQIRPVLEDIQTMMEELANKKCVSLLFEIEDDLNIIEADLDRFKQILINLINNAIKFNKMGGSVWVRLQKAEHDQWLNIEIEDTGIGIAQEKLSGLFRKFYQADTSSSRKHEGTGLGLALTKELVELHGGTIDVVSREHQGTTFILKFPFYQNQVSSAS